MGLAIKRKNKIWIYILIMCSVGIVSSCSLDIEKEDLINFNEPLTLTLRDSVYNEISITTILPFTPKYIQLKEWFKENSNGWHNSPASYMPRHTLTSEKFGLMIFENGIVITYRDKDNKPRQISKSIAVDEFDFLIIEN